MSWPIRLAVRAIIVREGRVLLVNAYANDRSDLWCAPGGGVEAGQSLADNLIREVQEETGLMITPGPLCHVHQFHRASDGFHQVDLFFLATAEGTIEETWRDPEGIVTKRQFFSEAELLTIRHKPVELARLAFGTPSTVMPGPLVPMAI